MRPLLVLAAVLACMFGSAAILGPHVPAPPLPAALAGDSAWLAAAVRIGRLRAALTVATLALTPVVLWSFTRRGSSARLRRRLQERGLRRPWLLVGAYTLALLGLLFLLQLPLDAAGFVIRRSFGLSSEPAVSWLARQVGEDAIGIGIASVAVEGLYWLLRRFPRRWWMLASLAYAAGSLGLVYLEPLVITPLFFTERRLEDEGLRARIVQMGARVGVPVGEVVVIDASRQGNEGNAYFTGIAGSTRIVLYDTLLQTYPADELLAILGHEMGHWREQHILQGLLLNWLAAPFAFFAAHRILRSSLPRWGIRAPDDVAGLSFLLLLANLAMIALLPLQNWQSRRWEVEADRFAVQATGDPQALARTLVRLARQNLSDPTPPPLIEALWATHPAIGRRVAALEKEPRNP